MTLHFFSPHQQYARGEAFAEFRAMVQTFHAAGIEVWLDVVYNHTAEGDQNGPTYSYRGIDNDSYYLLTPDLRHYINDTGCGNTVRTGHPAARVLVLESLRFWARNMGVDGFRFDLASIFSRAADGTVGTHEAALVAEIGLLARLFHVRLVAEAWDISSYQLGCGFPGMAWLQWNGKFRDDVRSFVRGEPGKVAALMQRLYGSDDLFPDALQDTRRPHQSVNFLTAHDGFCLYDLVAHNQDNEITWLDWARLEQHREVFRFFKLMIAFRKAHPSIGRLAFWREAVKWFGADGPVDLGAESRGLAYFLDGESVGDDDLYVMINGHWEDRAFTVQEGAPSAWRRVVDTAKPSPEDIVEPGQELKLDSASYLVRARSVVVLRRERA